MSKQTINIGASPNDGTGTPLRTSFDYTNQNFTELYTAVGPSGNNIVVPGSATISGNLTVDTNTLFVDSANDRVGIGTVTPAAGAKLGVTGATVVSTSDYIGSSTWAARFTGSSNGASSGISFFTNSSSGFPTPASIHATPIADYRSALVATYSADSSGAGYFAVNRSSPIGGNTLEHYKIDNAGVATWSNVGGVAGTAMTLNANGLGVGVTPSAWGSNYTPVELTKGACIYGAKNIPYTIVGANVYNDAVSEKYTISPSTAATKYQQTGGVHSWHNAVAGTINTAITFTQAMTLDGSGRLLVGNTNAFTDLTGSKEVRIGDSGMQTLTVASLPAATATNIARGGVGGLVYVGGFNGTGQYGAVVLWTAASATVVSVINGTGSTITFGVSAGFLQITSSLVLTQVTASCIRI